MVRRPDQKLPQKIVHWQIAEPVEKIEAVLAVDCQGPSGKAPLATSWHLLHLYYMPSLCDPRGSVLDPGAVMQSLSVKAEEKSMTVFHLNRTEEGSGQTCSVYQNMG